ncbi:valyl-tRNA synthetase [Roseovarius nanhaiticus]|uniref:Valine--tRNA ligase n=1 Tax=Roseovarius nanhaiticus TaxID=573024 RepID=A0A1N7FDW5_9RHOB|nr:valine--tRNA ligase [Roseovarius nanhaiticus]SEK56834.1 valyl-tRNA synthetase [Roseovarius nanhaiticus]SIR98470.1 valyl-tRNA synthetase [Roseovarius nanhaiticus]
MAMEKTFDAAEAEQRLYETWETSGAFKAGANARDGAEPFSIMIPPPNVTGSLHMGHAFNNTLQDILIRWHRMRGFDTLWQPGTDHAGIATQMVTERDMAANGEPTRVEMGREAFVDRVWQQKVKSRGTIIGQLKRLGASADWSREAFTMGGAAGDPDKGNGPNFHDAVIKVFVDMYDKGLIYRGKRLVNWDPHFETAISDLEVENVDTAGHMWHFKYPLAGGATYEYLEKDEDGNVTFRETRDYISIATTRPETMLGDGAVAVHPSDTRYAPIVGQMCEIPVGPKEHRRLIPIITDEYPDPDFGSGAVKITGAHDFNDYAVAKRGGIPCYRLMDTRARMRDDGAPYAEAAALAMEAAKGERELGEAEVDTINLVPDHLRGLDRFEARKRVVEEITEEGLAVMTQAHDPRLGAAAAKPLAPEEGGEAREDTLVPLVEAKQIMQPFGDRSKVVIEPMLTDQWFVDTQQIVGPALDAVRSGEVTILPESDRKVYFHWLENIEPWCISRQLWWGHQIPVWYGLDLERGAFRDDEGDGALDLVEMQRLLWDQSLAPGSDRYHAAPDFGALGDKFADVLAGLPTPLNHARLVEVASREDAMHRLAESLADYVSSQDPTTLVYPVWRDADVLDTWFSSGLWPIGTLGWPDETPELERYFPTSTLITGFDIIFFWVARMMMMQYAVVGQKPFAHVYVHALVRDEKGKKMSKSLGNVLDPLELIEEYGTDAVRFTLTAMAAMGRDLKLSTQRIAGYRNFGTKLWNAARFAEMNGATPAGLGEEYSINTLPRPEETVNRWIIGETAKVRMEVDAALEAYRFNDAASALYAFVWGKVCDWYVEFSKPLLMDGTDAVKRETQETMAWVIDQCLILLHPIMPFVTEELWGSLGSRDKMLIHADWPTYGEGAVDAAADREMNWVISLIEAVRSARAQMHVPAGAKIPLLATSLDEAGRTAWARNEAMILRLARVTGLEHVEAFPKGCATVAVEGGILGLPLADIIDVEAEVARLEKTLGKLDKEIGGLKGRVNNPKFVASAPDEVVEEARENLALRKEEAETLRAALARLQELG